ncbi:MAG: UbiD family decarboxylase [Rhodocyclaceae bacterium]|nr:MAG: UbiD family decarboxylase [Rhodocyclaceae bacterium]
MAKDLRYFLDRLRASGPDDLVEIDRQIPRDLYMTLIQEKLAKQRKYPAVMFKNVAGVDWPVVTGLFSSYRLLAHALEVKPTEPGQVLAEYIRREDHPIAPTPYRGGTAPVQEVVLTGDSIDLACLPIQQHCVGDSGRYITIGCLICRDPVSGVTNVGTYRHELKGSNRMGCMMNPVQHAATIRKRYHDEGKPMEVAVFIGHHPACHIGAASRGQLEHDEFAVMGGLLGEAVEMVPCKTVDLAVPAHAEVVIEGRIHPDSFQIDGPFAEYAGYYGAPMNVPIIEVTAITHRKQPIWHDLFPSFREHTQVGVLCREAQLFRRVREIVPSMLGVHLPPSGANFWHCYISIKKRVQGEGKLAGLAVLGSNYDVKHVVVVDDDIDIYSDEDVLWAMATRVQADQDCSVVTNSFGAHLDPSAYGETRSEKGPLTTKVIIDATRPLSKPFAQRVSPPKELWESVDLKDYLPGS